MSLRSPLSRARGLGSAKEGSSHWWWQRLTAVALIPLTLWFAYGIAAHAGDGYEAVREWVACPVTAIGLVVFFGALFHHSQLGLQVVIEDYVSSEAVKLTSLILIKFAHVVMAAAAIFAVLKIALGS
ncbi:MAG: succinate dehydrogenase, hydrophobic membrane anchor protein [Nevskiales bacterium]